ncbi:A/G-specific adenine glycosylase [Desulfococcaceae bacterium OttesenSCG-928-F15]|nr:A/G-specific adenine glycosylase [Desulfococcaceae bacterium OttesenSCG-928-F15]
MTLSARKMASFRKGLLAWYHENKRELPWRKTKDPYAIWISEVMLQQTRVDTVIPYYLSFMKNYPDLESLAESDPEALLKSWEGLGYYKRLQNIRKTTKIILEKMNGRFPEEAQDLKKLPGIGDYIAAAIASIAFGKKEAVVDGNVKRVLARLFCDPFPVNSHSAHKHFQSKADLLLSPENPSDFNQAIMELGATVCLPKKAFCEKCPVSSLCKAFTSKKQDLFPQKAPRKKIPFFKVACAAILDRDLRILVIKRPETGMLPGLWEFPGGKLEMNESEYEACKREIVEETGLYPVGFEHLCTVRHTYTHFRIALAFFVCHIRVVQKPQLPEQESRWVSFKELQTLALPAANKKCMVALESWLKEND